MIYMMAMTMTIHYLHVHLQYRMDGRESVACVHRVCVCICRASYEGFFYSLFVFFGKLAAVTTLYC